MLSSPHSLQRSLRRLVQVCNPEPGGQRCYLSPFMQLESRSSVYHPVPSVKQIWQCFPAPEECCIKGPEMHRQGECQLCFWNSIYFIYRECFSNIVLKLYLNPRKIVSIFSLNTIISANKSLINGKYNYKSNPKFSSCLHLWALGSKMVV